MKYLGAYLQIAVIAFAIISGGLWVRWTSEANAQATSENSIRLDKTDTELIQLQIESAVRSSQFTAMERDINKMQITQDETLRLIRKLLQQKGD